MRYAPEARDSGEERGPVKKQSLAQQTADTLYEMIADDGLWQPGDQLPNENELASKLGISRATLREAIHLLTAQGILTVQRGRGTFVARNANLSGRYDLGDLQLVRARLRDLFEARLLFEPELAAMACRRASDEELEHILSFGAAVEDAIRTGRDRTEFDQAFHQAIVTAAHNGFLARLVPIINHAVMEAIQFRGPEETLKKITLQDHSLLMDFIRDRDARGARQAMAIHLRRAIRSLGLNDSGEPRI